MLPARSAILVLLRGEASCAARIGVAPLRGCVGDRPRARLFARPRPAVLGIHTATTLLFGNVLAVDISMAVPTAAGARRRGALLAVILGALALAAA